MARILDPAFRDLQSAASRSLDRWQRPMTTRLSELPASTAGATIADYCNG